MIFSEEANKMWKKQEEVWRREESARQQLMEDVAKSWKHQMEERTSAARLVVDHEMARMKEIEEDIRDLRQKIADKEQSYDEHIQKVTKAFVGLSYFLLLPFINLII